ncbi:porin [Planctomyces sp. SH-PL62]|uniref:porin n=1 Tax=Planctomyces sp. SH-PL62 TaxID=1636152 RepID=UPI00078E4557|nr:porin [Planctomyces sp. SH-PL62]AMV40071.1 Phosphate-selective porin O and P [Planctomyces sp. SH-PL62]
MGRSASFRCIAERALASCVALAWSLAAAGQTPESPPIPAGTMPPAAPALSTDAEVLAEIRQLRAEVAEARQLKQQVEILQQQLQSANVGGGGFAGPAAPGAAGLGSGTVSDAPNSGFTGVPDRFASGAFAPEEGEPPDADRYPIRARYKYSHDATGPNGGGGYFNFSSLDDEFSLNITNSVTIDGTFFDRANLPTSEQGFNSPFTRMFFYGNITKDWSYQVGTQGFLGTYNLLDMFMTWHINKYVNLRAGKGLAPPLYEYYAFHPALEPVITNSPLYQLAAKRPIGMMFNGTLFNNRMQWWSGVTNAGIALYGDLNRNVDYNGAVDFTPFRGDAWKGSLLEGLGGGVGFSAGEQRYKLYQSSIGFLNNGEATTNPTFNTVVGLPFYVYNTDIAANGMRSRVAPHIYWYGRFSVLAEMMNHSRVLTDGRTTARSTQWAYYVNASYWLTGERDNMGNGFQGYSTAEPLRPFIPSRGEYGPGAWQLATQWSEFNAGRGDIDRGFVDPARSTERMDNFMAGVNWWPNKYTRISFDYVWTWFNNPIQMVGPGPIDQYNTFWMRFAMFF